MGFSTTDIIIKMQENKGEANSGTQDIDLFEMVVEKSKEDPSEEVICKKDFPKPVSCKENPSVEMDFEMIKKFGGEVDSSPPYFPYDIDHILARRIEKAVAEKKVEVINEEQYFTSFIIKSDKTAARQVALFKVVYRHDPVYGRLDLKEIMQNYITRMSGNIFVIPIADLSRRHFRLLVVDGIKQTMTYYDSKSMASSFGAEVGAAWVRSFFSEEMKSWRDCFFDIPKLCKEFLPAYNYSSVSLGHQSLLDNMRCGVYVAEYAWYIAMGEPLPSSFFNIDFETWAQMEIVQESSSASLSCRP